MVLPLETKLKSDKYFFSMSIILYIIMIIGFAHSFFFRASVLHRGPLSPIFIIHSVLNIAWFTALVSQSWLAIRNRIVNHKRNGIYWFFLSILVLLVNCVIVYNAAHKPPGPDGSLQMDVVGMVTGNTIITIQFVCFVGLSYFFRHRPEIHKRMILFATIGMIGTALDRFQRYEMLRFATSEMNTLIYNLMIPELLFFSILGYDLVTRRRPYFVTVILLLVNLSVIFIFYLVFATGIAQKYVEFLRVH